MYSWFYCPVRGGTMFGHEKAEGARWIRSTSVPALCLVIWGGSKIIWPEALDCGRFP